MGKKKEEKKKKDKKSKEKNIERKKVINIAPAKSVIGKVIFEEDEEDEDNTPLAEEDKPQARLPKFDPQDSNGDGIADHLQQLGSKETRYTYSDPDASMLETFISPKQGLVDHNTKFATEVKHTTVEFTSLCPKTGQPDFAEVTIVIVPDKLMVETKSLKLYLFSYRQCGKFMEHIVNQIADDLYAKLLPIKLIVSMEYAPRGGIATSAMAQRTNDAAHDDLYAEVE